MKDYTQRLTDLRDLLDDYSLDGLVIPKADQYLNKHVPDYDDRLKWLTGFTGSWGLAIVLKDKAVIYTHALYILEIKTQVNQDDFEIYEVPYHLPTDWLNENTKKGARIGYDPRLHSIKGLQSFEAKLDGPALVALDENLIDKIWTADSGVPSSAPAEIFPNDVAGKTSLEKRQDIAEKLKEKDASAFVITAQDSIAWLLNIRGHDIPHSTILLSYAILHEDASVDLFVDEAKIPKDIKTHIGDGLSVKSPVSLEAALKALGDKKVWLDHDIASMWFVNMLESATLLDEKDPCIAPKACKSKGEQAAMIETHIQDGVALCRLMHWFEQEGPSGTLTELDISNKVHEFRAENKDFVEDSFDAIAGWGPHGAVIHYRVNEKTSLTIEGDGLLLLDSGGHYHYGTTDVTRTMALGTPTEEMKLRYTQVLQGYLAVANARFPERTTGAGIDALARSALWADNLDFAHGTGHGVGCYLNVHEDGVGIHSQAGPFKPGMIVSNEPGFYKEGAFGIRIESLVLVEDRGKNEVTQEAMYGFRTLTLAPLELQLVLEDKLSPTEKDWINQYHADVYAQLSPRLKDYPDVLGWLKERTAKI